MRTKHTFFVAPNGKRASLVLDSFDSVADLGRYFDKSYSARFEDEFSDWEDPREAPRQEMLDSFKSGGTRADVDRFKAYTVDVPRVPPTSNVEIALDVVGVPCVPAILSGVPTWACMPVAEPDLGPVRIYLNPASNWQVPAATIAKRIALVARHASRIAESRPVELYMTLGCESRAPHGGGSAGLYLCLVRIPLPSSLASLAAVAVWPGWIRFGLWRCRVKDNDVRSRGGVPFFADPATVSGSVFRRQDQVIQTALDQVHGKSESVYVPMLDSATGSEAESERLYERFEALRP